MRLFWRLRVAFKELLCTLHLAGVVDLIEFCRDCGREQPVVWHVDDELWRSVTQYRGPEWAEGSGVLCLECFDRDASRWVGLLRWTAERA